MKRKTLILNCKKGNAVLDTALVLVVIFAFAILSILGYNTFNNLYDDISSDDISDESQTALDEVHNRYPAVLDGLMFFLFIGMWAMVIIASFMIDTKPIFFILSVILVLFIVIAGIFLGNFFEEYFQDAEISTVSSSFPMSVFLLSNMLYVGIAIGFSIIIVLFAKSRFE